MGSPAYKLEEERLDFTPKKAKWPEDISSIYRHRIKTLAKLESDPVSQVAVKKYYKSHPADFISDWMVTHDPRVIPQFLPFILWDRQREYIDWLYTMFRTSQDGLVEKSRDEGLTWMNMGFSIWLFLFHAGISVGFGSRKQDLVDRLGDPDSIFEKGRIILKHLPSIFLPEGFNIEKHCSFLKFINPENDSTITGEAGDNIGRGGRKSIYLKDESSFYERPKLIEASLSQNSDCKIDVSTPNGVGNPFHKKRFSFPSHRIFIFDWRDDPRKGKAWYKKQEEELDPLILAQEVDRDYEASAESVCIPGKWVRAAIELDIPAIGSTFAGFDVADEGEGSGKHALSIRKGVKVFFCKAWRKGTTTEATREVVGLCRENENAELRFDKIGVGAGARGESKSLNYPAVPIDSSNTNLPGWYIKPSRDNQGVKNKDMFMNLKAQAWWEMRRRFKRTFEHVNGIKEHELDDIISIPNDAELVVELSQPKYIRTESGRIKIESKQQMSTRGVGSPNKADSLIYCFCPIVKKTAGALR